MYNTALRISGDRKVIIKVSQGGVEIN